MEARSIEFVLSRPIASVPMVAKTARETQRGALNLIGELGVREVTGTGRASHWGYIWAILPCRLASGGAKEANGTNWTNVHAVHILIGRTMEFVPWPIQTCRSITMATAASLTGWRAKSPTR
ncbi:helix-turn-helix domain-containing protein [Mesorhizobium sp.]|uniref:helix-turn-helix domain-containing protein n=1 Tax=Mesorhizobium sp. TaxID=1871066 RepID=UPI0025CDA620|nr:helix-turn-helix domain-containing protein [Mesorhizobium sp.]